MSKEVSDSPHNFIRTIIDEDIAIKKNKGRVHTRFPPEPNGYLHIGHAKSICLNFGIAKDYRGICNLRFDDTNPTREEDEYVESIKKDISWLGFKWEQQLFFASDYFEQLYQYAEELILKGKAFVCDLNAAEMREYRGTLTEPGRESPFRDRTVDENLSLFRQMKAGAFKNGEKVLRARIDMNSSNLNMRDPVMYRIMHAEHHRTGNTWCIYPMYDWAHGLEDSIEGITHSICTLEFEDHRPLYNWFIEQLNVHHPQQIEFARLNLSYTIMSKRKLLELVEKKLVDGWDDPRMPTISGLRRRGYTPESIRNFAERIGVAKRDSMVDIALLEFCIREDLNKRAPRRMGVLKPLKLVIENFPENKIEWLEAVNNPEDTTAGVRKIPFTRELYIEQDDFKENPPKKFYRLAPGREVRLRYGYFVTCSKVIKDDATGEIIELRCTYDPATKGGNAPDGRKVKATLHWVSLTQAINAEVRLYDRLFTEENPLAVEGGDYLSCLNEKSLTILENCKLEPELCNPDSPVGYQFERLGYFIPDTVSNAKHLVFNQVVTLKDAWARIQKAEKKKMVVKPKVEQSIFEPVKDEIEFDDFLKIDLRVAKVLEADPVEGAKKLIRLLVDVGESKPRQIFAGIRKSYPEPNILIGKQVVIVANLKPRKMSFGVSEAMVLSGGIKDNLTVVTVAGNVKPGDTVS